MEKGQSQSKANKRMHRFNLGRPFAVFNHLKKKKNGAEKESIEGASISSFIPSIPTGGGSDQYDIFLSFRGSDTRKGFTYHLYRSLINVGTVPISVFKDDNSLEIGKDFDSEILDIITQSKISIPIISENYASSKWCLRELVRIMDCKKSMSHMVLPIFYKVNPSDVRYLKGKFGEAFHMRKKRFDEKDIQEGRQALTEVSYLNGWESEKFANGHEGELVEEVIKTIMSKLRHDFQLDVPTHLVGVGDHVNKIRNWVDTPASHARMIGIYGMGGIGQTTLAKVIYNELLNDFLHRSFLPDIRETTHHNGILYLQNLLIKEILPNEHQVCKVDDGISLIKSRFKGKRVLILLDDVDHQDQLNALARERDWFSTGSIIIVTTRYEAILDQPEFQADYKYELSELDEVHSLLLFKRHAFHMGHCSKDFEGVSRDILSTMGGLPLAIKVIGSYLYGKTNGKVWQDILKKLRNKPAKDVQKILMISYDALEPEHKNIFLDIACFFIGEDSKFAIYTWEDFYPYQGIEELKLSFHLAWFDMQARYCLKNYDTYFQWPRGCSPAYTSEQFKNLPSSRFLQLCWKALSGDFNELFSELRWLRWFYIEPNMLSSAINFHLSKLVVLELSQNKLAEDWTGWSSIMVRWKKRHPLDIPSSIGNLSFLQHLNLSQCSSLRDIPSSVGNLSSLLHLNLSHCSSLREIPNSIGNLSSLQYLNLSHCSSLREIPTSIGDLHKLQHLNIDNPLIKEIPDAIGRFKELRRIIIISHDSWGIGSVYCSRSLSKIIDTSLSTLPDCKDKSFLQNLLSQRFKVLRLMPKHPFGLTYLQYNFAIPKFLQLSCLIDLEELHLYACNQLESIQGLPSRLLKFCVDSCPNLILPELGRFKYLEELSIRRYNFIKRTDLSQWNRLKELDIQDCDNLVEIQGHGELEFLETINIYSCMSIERLILPKLQCLKRLHACSCNNLVEIRGLDKAELLKALDISNCSSIERLPKLGCFATLKELNINGCHHLHGVESLERFSSCRSIFIKDCKNLEKLPNLSKFENLESFIILGLIRLREIPRIGESKSLTKVSIIECQSLETLPDFSGCEKLRYVRVVTCDKLTQLWGLEKLDLTLLEIYGCQHVPELFKTCNGRYEYECFCIPEVIKLQ
ncbi:hypothetical protein ACJRO7_011165 [Eucalyptus globulus]|uniref:TIR domain-containing protein n=1 Tax=Eucalyptus globulus TaxID=34317 RepID=A0ABD3LHP2_EUCGL